MWRDLIKRRGNTDALYPLRPPNCGLEKVPDLRSGPDDQCGVTRSTGRTEGLLRRDVNHVVCRVDKTLELMSQCLEPIDCRAESNVLSNPMPEPGLVRREEVAAAVYLVVPRLKEEPIFPRHRLLKEDAGGGWRKVG